MKLRRALVSAAAVGITATSLSTVSPAFADEPLSINHIAINSYSSGHPALSQDWGGIVVFADDHTVVPGHTYGVEVTSRATGQTHTNQDRANFGVTEGEGWVRILVEKDPAMSPGTHDVTVTEYDTSGAVVAESAPVEWELTQIAHPDGPTFTGVKNGKVRAGSAVKIDWNGTFAPDARVIHVIGFLDPKADWYAATERDFIICVNWSCPADGTGGETPYVESDDVDLVTRLKVAKRYAGHLLVVAAHGYELNPQRTGAVSVPWGSLTEFKVTSAKQKNKK